MIRENRIMIVDDKPKAKGSTNQMMGNQNPNWEVMVMGSALKALNYLDAKQDKIEELPSLIILDLDMPAVNGIGFLERFSHYNDNFKNACKIVVLTEPNNTDDMDFITSDPCITKTMQRPSVKSQWAPLFDIVN
ncbi:MAG: response regulator [Pedobacter sp.]|nr:MAG: response regulator [Pedobacter sp.]